ncbi:MAG: ParB/RepB/Spo0J family partition protein [Sumerlaeia bacterium]
MGTSRKKALGKGLGALLGGKKEPQSVLEAEKHPVNQSSTFANHPATPSSSAQNPQNTLVDSLNNDGSGLLMLGVKELRPNPYQPRRMFDETKLEELRDSIKEHGVLQPLLACVDPEFPGKYLLLAGERRWRASQDAGFTEVPVRVVAAKDHEQLEFALIENIQRDNLSAVEEARAYQELAQTFGYSQDQVAKRVGKSRVAVANSIRLLKLTEYALQDIEDGRLTAGHARAILMLSHKLQQEALRKEILEQELTVRQAEERARDYQQGKVHLQDKPGSARTTPKKSTESGEQNLDVEHLSERLTQLLGCKVQIKARSVKRGRIEITYRSLDDMDRILDLLGLDRDNL